MQKILLHLKTCQILSAYQYDIMKWKEGKKYKVTKIVFMFVRIFRKHRNSEWERGKKPICL